MPSDSALCRFLILTSKPYLIALAQVRVLADNDSSTRWMGSTALSSLDNYGR
jgi:hypothetical protein